MTTTDLADKVNEADERQKAQIETTPRTRSLFDLLRDMEPQLRRAFPKTVDVGRFIRLAETSLRTVPKLLECTPESVMAGFMQAAQLGVEIDAIRGQAYLIPRYNSRARRQEASFQLGYRGLIDIAGRSGVTVSVRAVREADEFEHEDGLTPVLRHVPFLGGERGEARAYFAIARFADGRDPEFLVMSRAEVETVRDRFGQKNRDGQVSGPWVDHFDAMAFKTLVIRLLNYLPLPVEVHEAIRDDDAIAPMNVENTFGRPEEFPPPAGDAAPLVSPKRGDDAPGDAQPPAEGPVSEPPEETATAAEGPRPDPAAAVDPDGGSDLDTRGQAIAHVKGLLVDLAPQARDPWRAYVRTNGLSSNPDRWTEAQAVAAAAWIESPLDEEAP